MCKLKKKFIIILSSITFIILAGILSVYGINFYIDKYAEKYIANNNFPKCDAVMVLGALVYSDGKPSPVLEDRLLYALKLYNDKTVKKIIVSGDHGTKEYDEVNVMKNFLLERGVLREDIFMDHAGFDTYDSMYRAKNIFEIDSMIVSTQEFHIKRALYIARKIGIESYGNPSPDKEMYNMKLLNFREKLAKVKAFLDADILKRKSKFGGDAIPIWSDGALTDG